MHGSGYIVLLPTYINEILSSEDVGQPGTLTRVTRVSHGTQELGSGIREVDLYWD